MASGFELGAITIHRVVEQEAPFFDALQFFLSLTKELLAENRSWPQPRYFDKGDKIILCIQSYIVRTPHHVILIDSCVGNHKPRPGRTGDSSVWNMMSGSRYESNLAPTGVTVDDVDFVMCTHLHIDRVGWNTRLENGHWVPTFPRARYLFAERELEHWAERQKKNPASCPWITDSVLPIVVANQVEPERSDHTLDDLVRLVPTPGIRSITTQFR